MYRNDIQEFKIIESTLREGEQFVGANFTTGQKMEIAQALDDFGVEYLELTSPMVSPQSYEDIKQIANMGLKAKILTHIRCSKSDAARALELPLDGVDIVIGTSSMLRKFSHGKEIPQIIALAEEVIAYIKEQRPELEIRFSTEDSFRSKLEDLWEVYQVVDSLGIDRVGIADTVGVATPFDVYELTSKLKNLVNAELEFHGHNDSGCAIANSYAALVAGVTCIDTSVLGIGERNGITPLGGLIARLYATDPDLLRNKYDLKMLTRVDKLVAELVGVDIPFNNFITGITAFTHKAGIHAKAILNDPQTYEIIDPKDFGLSRYLSVAHRLTGWHAIKWRAQQLGIEMNEEKIKRVRALIEEVDLPIEMHTHNDFGMATANAIAGLEAGATYVNTTVNGLGERAGNAAMEELVMALQYTAGVEMDIQTSLFRDLGEICRLGFRAFSASLETGCGKQPICLRI